MSAEQPFNPELVENKVETPELQVERVTNEVARVFVLQSRSDESIAELCAGLQDKINEGSLTAEAVVDILANELLTHSLMIKKDEQSRNPGQVVPVGGGKTPEDRNDLSRTAVRELLEEIHVRPRGLKRLRDRMGNDIVIHYDQTLKKQGKPQVEKKTDMSLFIARISPSDIPHQQNKEEDKIASFPRSNLLDMGELWGNNTVTGKHGTLHLMDALQAFPQDTQGEKIDLKFPDKQKHLEAIAETMNAYGVEGRAFEIEKIIDVAKELAGIAEWKVGATESDQFTGLRKKIHELEFDTKELPKAQVLYREIVRECAQHIDLLEWFPHAVERSNFKEELRNPGNSKIEGALRFAFLMAKTNLSLSEIAILKKEIEFENGPPHVKSEYYDLIGFLKKIVGKKDDEDITEEDIINYAKSVEPNIYEEGYDELLQNHEEEFAKKTGIKNLGNKTGRIDKFLLTMFKMGVESGSDAKLNDLRGDPLSNVMGPNLENLLSCAFDQAPVPGFLSEDSKIRLKFEALRKLFLLSVLEPASQRYSVVERLGNGKIEEVWNKLFFIDEKTQHVSTAESDDETKYMRGFKSIEGLLVSQNVRPKLIDSYFRKIIMRGFDDPEDLWDIYGRSLVLAVDKNTESEKTNELFTRQDFEIETYSVNYEKKLIPEKQTVTEYPAVIEIIKQLQAQGAKIVDYDPTNVPGTSFNSAGPGGGDPITMAKFYICLETPTARGTTRRFEEVQVFSPTEDGKSGFQNKETKEFYDRQRAVRRLLDTKGLRSFIELMFPIGIYGDLIHNLYKKNGNGNGHK